MSSSRKNKSKQAGCANGGCEVNCARGQCTSFRGKRIVEEASTLCEPVCKPSKFKCEESESFEVQVCKPKKSCKPKKPVCDESDSIEVAKCPIVKTKQSKVCKDEVKTIKRTTIRGAGSVSLTDVPLTQTLRVIIPGTDPVTTALVTFPAIVSSIEQVCSDVDCEVGQTCDGVANVLASASVTFRYSIWPFASVPVIPPTVPGPIIDFSGANPELLTTQYSTSVTSLSPSLIQVPHRAITKCDVFEACCKACEIREVPDVVVSSFGIAPAPIVNTLTADSVTVEFGVSVTLTGWKCKQPGPPVICDICPHVFPAAGTTPIDVTLNGENLFGTVFLNDIPLETVFSRTQRPCSITARLPFTATEAAGLQDTFCLFVVNPDGTRSNGVGIGSASVVQVAV